MRLVLLSFVDGGHGVDGEANGLAMCGGAVLPASTTELVLFMLMTYCVICIAVVLLEFRAVSF